jgi:lysophospholipase L1-like esterase
VSRPVASLPRAWRALAIAGPSLLLLLALGLAEMLFRLLLAPVAPLEVFVRDPHQRMGFTDRRRVGIFEFDPELFWRLRPGLGDTIWDFTRLSTNAQGLRHATSLGAKAEGTFRVLCVGDSVTFGYRVPVVWAEHPDRFDRNARPYPMLLEARLREANPGRDVEVVALAVPGYSSYQGRLWLAREIERLRPDLVTTLFGWNDVNQRSAPDSQVMAAGWARVRLRALAASSQALLHAAVAIQGGTAPRTASGRGALRVERHEFVANHLAMHELATGVGAGFVGLGSVYRDALGNPEETARLAGHRAALREALSARGIPYLEVPELTEAGHPGNQALFGEPIHPNAEGHRLLAERLGAFLAQRKLLAGLRWPE